MRRGAVHQRYIQWSWSNRERIESDGGTDRRRDSTDWGWYRLDAWWESGYLLGRIEHRARH